MLGRTFLACAAFVVAAVAQSRIAFTVLPTNIVAGQPVTIQWGGGDNSVSNPAPHPLSALETNKPRS
jgi:hypothetical protein